VKVRPLIWKENRHGSMPKRSASSRNLDREGAQEC
jgi:hypothetical protein